MTNVQNLQLLARAGPEPDGVAGGIAFASQPDIRTSRLRLRKPDDTDSQALATGLGNFSVARMLMRIPQPYHTTDAREWVALWHNGALSGWAFVMVGEEGVPIGVVSVRMEDRHELGYWLMPQYWQRSLMSEAVNAVIERFFATSIGETLFSSVIADNPASLKLQARLGFAITGCKDGWCRSRGEMVKLITTELTFGGFTPL